MKRITARTLGPQLDIKNTGVCFELNNVSFK